MRRLFFLVVLSFMLTALCWAEPQWSRVSSVKQSVQDDRLRLVVETEGAKPQASAFFVSSPDRLIVEFNDAKPGTKLGRRPSSKMIKSWSLKANGLNRTRLTLNLAYLPPYSELKVKNSGSKFELEMPLQTGLKEKIALTDGIKWIREDTLMAGRWVRTNRLIFDPKDPDIEVQIGLAKERVDAREPLSKMVKRYDAIAGINGGFFAGKGGALGLVYRDGKMLAPHVSRRPPRSGFGLTSRGKPLFGRLAATGPKIKDLDGGDWSKVTLALGGGPRLIKNGATKITANLEELGPKGNDITRVAARTVVGMTESGNLLFATITGYRDNHSQGTKFGSLVNWLKGKKVKEAVNFDGGASVDMVIGGHIVSDGPANRTKEKPVATALLVSDKRKRLYPDSISWSMKTKVLPADGSSSTKVNLKLTTPSGKAVPDGTKVQMMASGLRVDPALVKSENGKASFTIHSVRNPGKAKIKVTAGPTTVEKRLSLRAGSCQRVLIESVKAESVKEDENSQRVTVKVQTLDSWGNGAPKESFTCFVDGLEAGEFRTNKRGMMTLEVDLAKSGGSFSVSHPVAGQVKHTIQALESD